MNITENTTQELQVISWKSIAETESFLANKQTQLESAYNNLIATLARNNTPQNRGSAAYMRNQISTIKWLRAVNQQRL